MMEILFLAFCIVVPCAILLREWHEDTRGMASIDEEE
jgi:hypothetical protein